MAWHIRRTAKDGTSGFKYYQGATAKTPNGNASPWGSYGTRATYTSQAKAKDASISIWNEPEWTTTAINENAS